jgi:HK97 family phage portal protein
LSIIDFFRDIFQPDRTYKLNQKIISDKKRKLDIESFFTHMAFNMIAGTVAKCEFKTYVKGNEVKSDEYYLWNIEPNDNQNGSQFMQELITKLLSRNEALVVEVNGKLLIADSFSRTPFALFPDSFTGVTCGDLTFDKTFSMSDVLYFRLNYHDIRLFLSQLMSGYSDILDMAVGKYKRSGGRKGIVKGNRTRTGDKKQREEIDNLFNNQFKNYFEAENAVVELPSGLEYSEQTGDGSKKSTSEVADIQGITKEAIARVAQAVSMPPALLQGDIADVSTVTDNYLTFCIDPLLDLIETEIIRKRYGKAAFLANTYLRIDTTCIRHIDIFSIAEQANKLIADGVYSVDEIRQKIGDTPLNTWWSKKHWMTSNYADITKTGGETNETNTDNLGGQDGSGST